MGACVEGNYDSSEMLGFVMLTDGGEVGNCILESMFLHFESNVMEIFLHERGATRYLWSDQ